MTLHDFTAFDSNRNEISLDRYIGFYKMKSLYVIDKILKENYIIPDTSLKGGWGPCKNNFFETWVKIKIKLSNLFN